MSDYERISSAISFIVENAQSQPTLDIVAAHLNLSPFHFQRIFCRWTGVTPKRYLQTLTVERAKKLLAESKSILEVSNAVGLSSSSRLHDHFVQLDAVTPGEYKKYGEGITVEYAIHPSPFGDLFIAITPRGICKLSFIDHDSSEKILADLQNQWPNATFQKITTRTRAIIDSMFDSDIAIDRPLSLYVTGTNFQINVWRALLRIPSGTVASYTQVANAIGSPRSARAVGTAIGVNPAAFLIPCHRVIQQSGKLAGYRWGETRKHAMHIWESANNQ